MPRGRYKKYLEPSSRKKIPRSTLSQRRKLRNQQIDFGINMNVKEGMENIEDSENIKNIEDIEDVEDIRDVEGTEDTEDIEHIEDIEDVENISDMEEIEHMEDIEDVESIRDMEDIEDIENITGMEDIEDVESIRNMENIEDVINMEDIIRDMEDIEDMEETKDPGLQKCLCPCTKTTVRETLLLCMKLGVRHSLTWIAITDILKINIAFNRDVIPCTKYKLQKYFPADIHKVQYHVMCPECATYLGKKDRKHEIILCQCGKEVNSLETYFLEFDIKSQIQNMLSNAAIVNNLQYRFCRKKVNEEALEDIYDGEQYKKYIELNSLENKYNFSYTFNTDGCQTANSSKVSMWPIYLMINELPLNIRLKNILVAGLWINKSEPRMEIFLQPFVDQANELTTTGLSWKFNNNIIHSKIYPLLCSVDSVARCAMLNMKQYNGRFGCTFCEHPTSNISGVRKYPISTTIPQNRTDASIKRDMILAYEMNNEQDINGVWGPSPLMNLKYYDLAEGMVPDYMHSILLGVTRQYTEIILTSVNKDFYVGSPNKLAIINNRLLTISPPTSIPRTPRNLNERKMWKASEWRSWLLLYSLICLQGVLPHKYLRHLSLFVAAINILLQDSITSDMLQRAERLLIKFVILFQKYFTKQAMSYNVHLILHLCKGVRNWGPLWTHSTFPFESQNRFLLQLTKNPNQRATEVAFRILSFQKISTFQQKINPSSAIKNYCNLISRTRPLKKNVEQIGNCLLIGSGKTCNLSTEELVCLGVPDEYIAFDKIIYNGIRYTTLTYSQRCKRYNDSIVQMKSGEIGCISRILRIDKRGAIQIVIFINVIKVNPFFDTNIVKHIKTCYIHHDLKIFKPEDIIRQCVLVTYNDRNYVSVIPKGCIGE